MRNLISILILIALILMTLPYENKSIQNDRENGKERLKNIEETQYLILEPNPRKMIYGIVESQISIDTNLVATYSAKSGSPHFLKRQVK